MGITAPPVADVLAAAAVPSGVLYHHFPDGKTHLVEAAVESAGALTLAELDAVFGQGKAWRQAVREVLALWSRRLVESDYQTGCPVTAAAADLEGEGGLQRACAAAYESWIRRLAAAIEADGVDPEDARGKALAVVAAAEGALLLSKALRATEPLDRAADFIGASSK